MKITDEKWNEIITATREGIARWNARAKEKSCPDSFSCETTTGGPYTVLVTSHTQEGGYHTERKAIAREISSGEMRSGRLMSHNGRVTGIKVKSVDPKGWRNLDTQPTAEIVKKLKLLDFLMVVSATVTDVRTAAE